MCAAIASTESDEGSARHNRSARVWFGAAVMACESLAISRDSRRSETWSPEVAQSTSAAL